MDKWKKAADNARKKAGGDSVVGGPAKKGPLPVPAGEKFTIEKQFTLPLCAITKRAVPNGFLRSALFAVVQPGRRKYLQDEKIVSVGGVDIIYTGTQLNQNDLDVWEQCIHLGQKINLSDESPLYFDGNKFLKEIGRKTGGTQHKWLKTTLKRLMSAVIEINDSGNYYIGSLLNKGAYDKKENTYVIVMNKEIANLYGRNTWTLLEIKQRLAFKNKYLSKWLHGFYSTHVKPYPYRIETIYKLCGSRASEISDFKKDLIKALQELEKITGWKCYLEEDLIIVSKS